MQDRFKRKIDYLRISVTDLCNLRCSYCMPEEGVIQKSHDEILTYEEIMRIIEAIVPLGISKIRLTGGEPLVRKDLPDLIRSIAKIPEIKDIALTTNAILLEKMAQELKECGLNRINISLDTLKVDKYKELTRCGDLDRVLRGIDEALRVGLDPVKINAVVIKGWNEDELLDLAALSIKMPVHVRFIELMPIGQSSESALDSYLPMADIKKILESKYSLVKNISLNGNGPAENYKILDSKGSIGFIGALSNHFCAKCNRLRLTADGKLRPCLHKNLEIDLRTALRQGASSEEIREIFLEAIFNKPKEHNMEIEKWNDQERIMSQIGG